MYPCDESEDACKHIEVENLMCRQEWKTNSKNIKNPSQDNRKFFLNTWQAWVSYLGQYKMLYYVISSRLSLLFILIYQLLLRIIELIKHIKRYYDIFHTSVVIKWDYLSLENQERCEGLVIHILEPCVEIFCLENILGQVCPTSLFFNNNTNQMLICIPSTLVVMSLYM